MSNLEYRQHLLSQARNELRRVKGAKQEVIRKEREPNGAYNYSDCELQGEHYAPTFESTFRRAIPNEYKGSLRRCIEERLEHKKGEAIGIEFGGPARALFGGFSEGFFRKTAGVTLVDRRGWLRGGGDKVDSNHTVIEGDVFNRTTLQKVRVWLGSEKADIIIERMLAGLKNVPANILFLSRRLKEWYGLLNEGGMMFIQLEHDDYSLFISPSQRDLFVKWVEMVNREFEGKIRIELRDDVMRLDKLPGAPEELPLLEARQIT